MSFFNLAPAAASTESLRGLGLYIDSPTQRFHSQYASPNGIVLEAADGLCFGCDMEVLLSHSLFLQNRANVDSLYLLPNPNHPVFCLPISSEALHFSIGCIQALHFGVSPPPIPCPYHHFLPDIIVFADMLQCPEMLNLLFHALEGCPTPYQFIVAAVAGNAGAMYALTPSLLAYSDEWWDHVWWQGLLVAKSPDIHCLLVPLFTEWWASLDYLKKQLYRSPNLTRRGAAQFPTHDLANCDMNKRYAVHIDDFRSVVARQLWDSFAAYPLISPYSARGATLESLAPHVESLNISCTFCRREIAVTLKGILDHWPLVDWHVKRVLGEVCTPSPEDGDAWRIGYPEVKWVQENEVPTEWVPENEVPTVEMEINSPSSWSDAAIVSAVALTE